MVSIGLVGNCQAVGVADALAAATGCETKVYSAHAVHLGETNPAEVAANHDHFLMLRGMKCSPVGVQFPALSFYGFHPDCVSAVFDDGAKPRGPMGSGNSAIRPRSC